MKLLSLGTFRGCIKEDKVTLVWRGRVGREVREEAGKRVAIHWTRAQRDERRGGRRLQAKTPERTVTAPAAPIFKNEMLI